MITGLYLQNFKAFETLDVRCAPLTFIYGPNSVGKSSLLQALLVLSQSLDLDDVHGGACVPLRLVPNGRHVKLGTFRQLCHGHSDKHIVIGLRLRSEADSEDEGEVRLEYTADDEQNGRLVRVQLRWLKGTGAYRSAFRDVWMTFEQEADELWSIDPESTRLLLQSVAAELRQEWLVDALPGIVAELARTDPEDPPLAASDLRIWMSQPSDFLSGLRANLVRPGPDAVAYAESFSSEQVDNAIAEDTRWPLNGDAPSTRSDHVVRDETGDAPHARKLSEGLGVALHKISAALMFHGVIPRMYTTHIGPHRPPGQRLYFDADQVHGVVSGGERLPQLLLSNRTVEKLVNDILKTMEIPYSVSAKRESLRGGAVPAMRLQVSPVPNPLNLDLDLVDVGFGLSQILPILAQWAVLRLTGEHHGMAELLVEQPELHLNPSWQAALASVFLGAFPGDERRIGGRLPQCLLETHSELAMLRARRLVRRGLVPPADVTAIVLHRPAGSNATVAENIEFSESGRFKRMWPDDGFFAQRDEENAG